jgi:hypothetical protein
MITLYVYHALDSRKQMLLAAYNQLTDTTASIAGNDARGTVEGIAVVGNGAVTGMRSDMNLTYTEHLAITGHHGMKAYGGMEEYLQKIINNGITWR